jgi:hypothetical protein
MLASWKVWCRRPRVCTVVCLVVKELSRYVAVRGLFMSMGLLERACS